MTEESLREADIFVGIIKEKIGEEIILWMNRCENKDVNSLKDIGKEAMEERQSEITAMGEKILIGFEHVLLKVIYQRKFWEKLKVRKP